MARKYTDSSFVIQTTANISAQRGKSVDQIPFSLIPFTAKSTTAQKVCLSPPFGDKAYIVAQRPNPRDFLFEPEKLNLKYREVSESDLENIKINAAYGSVTLISDGGNNWYII